jgi:hypothetical protein
MARAEVAQAVDRSATAATGRAALDGRDALLSCWSAMLAASFVADPAPAEARLPDLEALEGYGAQGRNRTTDTAIFSRMLYQLSYLGVVRAGVGLGRRGV